MVEFLAAMVTRKNLTDKQRIRLKDYLSEHLVNGLLPRGIFGVAAIEFSVARPTVSRLWKLRHASHATAFNGEWDVTSGKKSCGRWLKYSC
jgi:hypothetical protein